MRALFNPIHRRGEPIKWGLVSYTIAIFAVETVLTAMNLHILSISYVDNREYPGVKGMTNPGPNGYQIIISPEAVSIIANATFTLSDWLANGLLVSSWLTPRSPTQVSKCLTPAPPIALSLLCHLCQELLGHRLPMPNVPCLAGQVFQLSTIGGSIPG